MSKLQVELAQSYNKLGQPGEALNVLCGSETECLPKTALSIARSYNDKATEAAALGVLGDTYRARGKYEQAITTIEESLHISSGLDNPIYQLSGFNSLGNIYVTLAKINHYRSELANQKGDIQEQEKLLTQARDYDKLALENWAKSLNIASKLPNQSDLTAKITVNMLEPLYRSQNPNFEAEREKAKALVASLPNSASKVYNTINLANFMQPDSAINPRGSNYKCYDEPQNPETEALLKQGINIAQTIENNRAQSFALGRLGHYYECGKQNDLALSNTNEAILLAEQDLANKDSLYLWEWQAGRILKAENQPEKAIKAYDRAIFLVEQIRNDILAANRELQLDFRTSIEPIYRQLADLKLQNIKVASEGQVKLDQVINTIDSLKIAELQNYLGSDCVGAEVNKTNIDFFEKQQGTAIFNTIIFPTYTKVIVNLPTGEKKTAVINITQEALREEINEFRRGLERYRDLNYDTTQAQKLYNWFVSPFMEDLEKANVTNLVFVNDGILRTVPLGALHDGEKFLIEKYVIATTPSLSLTKINTKQQTRQALALGVTKSVTIDGRKFPALNSVSEEIKEIQSRFPESKSLIDENFSTKNFEQELSRLPYSIIHISTHGKFSSEPENTFLVTGDGQKLTMNDLEKAIREFSQESEVIELLVLTACQAAVGDDRASLGFAGVAVQSGVKSVLASMWFIQDSTTAELVINFYKNWQLGLTKSKALRLVQVNFIKKGGIEAHPAYWAPLVMIGNWE